MNLSLSVMFLLSLLISSSSLLLPFLLAPPSSPSPEREPQSELTLPLVPTHTPHTHLPTETPTPLVWGAQRQASERLRAHSHLTGSCRQPGVGLEKSSWTKSDLKSILLGPRTGWVQGHAGWSWSKSWPMSTCPQGVKDLVPGQAGPQEVLL